MVERLAPTRVHRFYRGGALIDRLRGQPEEDGSLPEDWVGSVTRANNPGWDEGLSHLADGRVLKDVIEADPDYWLGPGRTSTGLLVKLLDAAERLPVHAHPDREFAQRHFGSPFGKTEAWIVLETRGPESEVWIGLREPVEADVYRSWIDQQDTDALLGSLNHTPVRRGDVVFVPAGIPHAIGAGALIAELQEPTDYSIVCEWTGFEIDPSHADLGLGWDIALDALELGAHKSVLELPPDAAAFFWADEVPEPAARFAVLLVLEGEGEVDGHRARTGDAFVMPAAADRLDISGNLRILRCLGPQ